MSPPDGHRRADVQRTPPPRAGWIVGAVAVAILVYITVNTLTTSGPGSAGPPAGSQLPPFAAPLVLSDLEGDANVADREGAGDAGARPACTVTDRRALNVCALVRRGPVVLVFLDPSAGRCVDELDTVEAVARRFPRVDFAAVAIRGSRDDLRALVRERGWSFPIAHDRDGAVANLYGIAVCPTVVFATRGGRVLETGLGNAVTGERALARAVRRLVAASAAERARAGGRGGA